MAETLQKEGFVVVVPDITNHPEVTIRVVFSLSQIRD
jgi:predicted RNA-binding protein with TRAM domain